MEDCWELFGSSIRARTDVWFSIECQAGRPRTMPIEYNSSVITSGSLDRAYWGQGDCCILLVIHGYPLSPGSWNNAGLIDLLCSLLGFQSKSHFNTAMKDVTSRATCEIVPVSHLASWYDCRKAVLDAPSDGRNTRMHKSLSYRKLVVLCNISNYQSL